MTQLFNAVPCGGCMVPPNATGEAVASDILANILFFVLPAGLILFLRKRGRR